MNAPDDRLDLLKKWLAAELPAIAGTADYDLAPASADASFRRYFRLVLGSGETLIVMDAPPPQEDCRPFIVRASEFAAAGLRVPQVLASDVERGLLLLSDLGVDTYFAQLNPGTADSLYRAAIDALILQQQQPCASLPAYDEPLLRREMQLFPEWLVEQHLGLSLDAELWQQVSDTMVANALAQPPVYVHRDYHSRNLMVCSAEAEDFAPAAKIASPGILDFQDAVAGPASYDLVSLLKDCYVSWPREQTLAWLAYYNDSAVEAGLAKVSLREFDLMGAQRQLKAAGIFARLFIRDGKPGYLPDVPRTLGYIVELGEHYAELAPFADWLSAVLLPALAAKAGSIN